MPTGVQLSNFQQQGLLPSPLPAYTRDAIDYLIGFSLWLILALLPLGALFDHYRRKAQAPKQLALLKSTARRVMARVASTSAAPERAALARQIYQQLFMEPLAEAEFAADMDWVRNEPAACDGFLGSMGRKFNGSTKLLLLRASASVAMANGQLPAGEAEALGHIAGKLGMKPKEVQKYLAALRQAAGGFASSAA